MNVKETINFKILREKGPSAIDIKEEEVVQLVSSKKEILCIVRQEYLLELEAAYNSILIRNGLKKQETVNLDFEAKNFSHELNHIMGLAAADSKAFAAPNLKLGMALKSTALEMPTKPEFDLLKEKITRLEKNHPEFFKEKKK